MPVNRFHQINRKARRRPQRETLMDATDDVPSLGLVLSSLAAVKGRKGPPSFKRGT